MANEGDEELGEEGEALKRNACSLCCCWVKRYPKAFHNIWKFKALKKVVLRPNREMTVKKVMVKVGDVINVGEVLVEFESELQNEKKKLAQ